jgi:hypothetical protein
MTHPATAVRRTVASMSKERRPPHVKEPSHQRGRR